jgi:hypothetical protein
LISAWLDASLGSTETEWPKRASYLELLRRKYGQLEPIVADIRDMIAAIDLWDRSAYELALTRVLRTLRTVA